MSARRPLTVLAAALALMTAAPAAAPAAEQIIASGVTAGGVDLGGQTVESAAATLELRLGPVLNGPVDVRVGARTFRLQPSEAKFSFDALRTAKRAYYAGRDKGPGQEVPLALSYSNEALRAWAAEVDRKTARKGRDASVRITVRRLVVTSARHGRAIDDVQLARRLAATLSDPERPRVLRQRLRKVRPKVTLQDVRRRYATVLTVDRTTLKLRLFKRLKLAKTYPIAIGAAGYDTPAGLFRIQNKQVNPAWHVPDSDWAGSLRGKVIPGGAPNNPLKARWLGVNGSVGIHGTAEEWSIGTRASHGCIRMRVSDVIDLYPRVPVGTPVLIK